MYTPDARPVTQPRNDDTDVCVCVREREREREGNLFETAADAWLHVAAAERGDLAELSRYLNALVQQRVQARLVHETVCVGDQSKHSCTRYR